jgi:hypothetical protein
MSIPHTPGPWFAIWNGHFYDISASEKQYAPSFAMVFVGNKKIANTEGNPNLIAAAPELLEELKNCVAIVQGAAPDHNLAIARAKAAIYKAMGELRYGSDPAKIQS